MEGRTFQAKVLIVLHLSRSALRPSWGRAYTCCRCSAPDTTNCASERRYDRPQRSDHGSGANPENTAPGTRPRPLSPGRRNFGSTVGLKVPRPLRRPSHAPATKIATFMPQPTKIAYATNSTQWESKCSRRRICRHRRVMKRNTDGAISHPARFCRAALYMGVPKYGVPKILLSAQGTSAPSRSCAMALALPPGSATRRKDAPSPRKTCWWAVQVSNLRPSACKADALPLS